MKGLLACAGTSDNNRLYSAFTSNKFKSQLSGEKSMRQKRGMWGSKKLGGGKTKQTGLEAWSSWVIEVDTQLPLQVQQPVDH